MFITLRSCTEPNSGLRSVREAYDDILAEVTAAEVSQADLRGLGSRWSKHKAQLDTRK